MLSKKLTEKRGIMKRNKKMCLGLLIVFALLIAGSANAQPTKAAKPLILRIAEMSPSTGTRPIFLQRACSEVEKLTDGRIKTEIYWSESLVKVKEIPKAIQRGVCDIGWISPGYHPAEFPLWTHFLAVLYHPQADDAAWLAKKAWEIFDASKALRADMEKMGQIAWFCCPYDSYPMYSKKIVKSIEDMKGMRIRVSGEGYSKMVKAIGGHPTFIPASDTYSGLERGTVEGAIAGWEWGKRYGFFEVVPYVIETNVFMQYGFNTVSLAALGKMSEQDRKIFLEVGRRVSTEFAETMKNEREDYKAFMQGKGVKILPFPAQERERWAQVPAVKALIKDWIEEQNKAGRPGSEVMRTFLKTIDRPQWMPPGY
jgi:TRAP-type C4-dicarboxylate transport system substrate-binding protein